MGGRVHSCDLLQSKGLGILEHTHTCTILIVLQDLASALIYTWYWLVYAINVFVYVIYLPRCREAILTLLAELFSPLINKLQLGTRTRTQTETEWGVKMGRVTREVCLQSESESGQHQSHSESRKESERIPRSSNVKTQISLTTKTLTLPRKLESKIFDAQKSVIYQKKRIEKCFQKIGLKKSIYGAPGELFQF